MAAVIGRSVHVVYLGLVVLLLLGFATPAFSLFINTSNTSPCSSTCESQDCTDPFTLKYGKYCGIGYTGCKGQAPCDGLDTCCQTHDSCIGSNLANYVNRTCNDNLKTCASNFKSSGAAPFSGSNCSVSDVEAVIILTMDAATVGSHGNRSFQTNLQWVTIAMFMLSAILLYS